MKNAMGEDGGMVINLMQRNGRDVCQITVYQSGRICPQCEAPLEPRRAHQCERASTEDSFSQTFRKAFEVRRA